MVGSFSLASLPGNTAGLVLAEPNLNYLLTKNINNVKLFSNMRNLSKESYFAKRSPRLKIFIAIALLILIAFGGFRLLQAITNWFDTYTLTFHPPLEITFYPPVQVVKRQVKKEEIVKIINEVPQLDGLNEIEKYICQKFGVYNCKTAIAIAKAESNLDEDALNVNKDGSVDVGIFQINSRHFAKEGCSLQEIVFAKKNIDCAYKIFRDQGWRPWTAFRNGDFRGYLK